MPPKKPGDIDPTIETIEDLETAKFHTEELAKATIASKDYRDQINALNEAILKGKDALDNYISKMQFLSAEQIKAREASGGFYKGISVANEKLEEEIKLLDQVSTALESKYNEGLRNYIDIIENLNKHLDEHKISQDELIDQTEIIKKIEEERQKNLKTISDGFAGDRLIAEARTNNIILEADLQKANNIQLAYRLKQEKELFENLPKLMNENNLRKLQADSINDVSKVTVDLTKNMFGASTQSNIFTSAAIAMTDKSKALSNVFGGLGESFLKPENAMNRFFNFLNKNLIQSTFEFDKILSEVNKTTGGFRQEFEKTAMTSAGPFSGANIGNLSVYGVNLEKLGKAYSDLSNKINGFNNMAASQKKILMENAATMETLGVSTQTYAGVTSNLMGAVSKTAEGARNTINLLARDAIAAGRNVGEYVREFEQLMPKIVGYGREATQIFKELNAFAGMTKGVMSTGDLQGFASQFDNWDSAAESVSKLNVALGGASVNIADLMKADPTEKLMMLKRAFDESGQDFDKLNIGYKRMLAEAFGGDVAKAASFFKGSLADANAEMQRAAATEEELAERKKKSVDAQEKLTKAIESMKLSLTPVINIIAGIAEGIAGLNNTIGPFGTFLTIAVPAGILAIHGMFKLLPVIASTSLKQVTGVVKIELDQVIAKANQARSAINSINILESGGSKGGGRGKEPELSDIVGGEKETPGKSRVGGIKSGFMTGLKAGAGAAALGILTMAISDIASSGGSKTVSNSQFLTNSPSVVPSIEGGEMESSARQNVYAQKTGEPLRLVAQANPKDVFKASTPEEEAKKMSIINKDNPLREFISSLNTETKSSNNVITTRIESLSKESDKRLETQKEVFNKIANNFNPVINIKATASLDPKAADELNRRAVNEAVKRSQQDQTMKTPSNILPADSGIA